MKAMTKVLVAAAVTCLLSAPSAHAQGISGAATSTSGATCSGGGSTDGDCRNSSAFTANTSSTITSRYAWNINADTTVFSTHNTSGNAQHHVTFTATAPAEVWIDGKSVGQTPLIDLPLEIGSHHVRMKSGSAERQFTVTATMTPVNFNEDFSK